MDFPGTKIDGKPFFPPAIAEQRRKRWASIKEGGHFVSSLTVPRASKSNKQLGAIWGLMIAMAVQELNDSGYDTSFIYNTNTPTGNAITKDDLCQFLYQVCPIHSDGVRITLSKADTEEAAKFFDDVRNWMSSQWGIIVPEPNPDWRNNEQQPRR